MKYIRELIMASGRSRNNNNGIIVSWLSWSNSRFGYHSEQVHQSGENEWVGPLQLEVNNYRFCLFPQLSFAL